MVFDCLSIRNCGLSCSRRGKNLPEKVAQGPPSGPAALPPRRALGDADKKRFLDFPSRSKTRIVLWAARQVPAPLEEPQGRRAGPALHVPGMQRTGAAKGLLRVLAFSKGRRWPT